MKMVEDSRWYGFVRCGSNTLDGLQEYTILSGIKEFVAWLQISQVPTVRIHSVSLLAEFVKGFLTNFLLDIAAMLSYKATESFPNSVLPFFYHMMRVRAVMLFRLGPAHFGTFVQTPPFHAGVPNTHLAFQQSGSCLDSRKERERK
jgi:hypothetical protein